MTEQVREDLRYVRAALDRSERGSRASPVYLLWALLIPPGFALPDFAPHLAGPYWMAVAPAGTLASFVLAYRTAVRRGAVDRRQGAAHAWHWAFTLLAFGAAALPALSSPLGGAGVAPTMLLVAALAYGLAGAHLDPPLRWAGLAMLAGYVALVMLGPPYVWTATGVIVGAALAWSGLRARGA